jgi:hypothetical protein
MDDEAAYDALLANYRDLGKAVRMIRQTVESALGARVQMIASEQRETLLQECEDIARAVADYARLEQEELVALRAALSETMPTDAQVEAAASVIFCHAQFKGDDYTARQLARLCLERSRATILASKATEAG